MSLISLEIKVVGFPLIVVLPGVKVVCAPAGVNATFTPGNAILRGNQQAIRSANRRFS